MARTSVNEHDEPVEVAALPTSPSSHHMGKARNSTWDGHPAQWPLGSDDGRSTSVSLVALLRKRQLRSRRMVNVCSLLPQGHTVGR